MKMNPFWKVLFEKNFGKKLFFFFAIKLKYLGEIISAFRKAGGGAIPRRSTQVPSDRLCLESPWSSSGRRLFIVNKRFSFCAAAYKSWVRPIIMAPPYFGNPWWPTLPLLPAFFLAKSLPNSRVCHSES